MSGRQPVPAVIGLSWLFSGKPGESPFIGGRLWLMVWRQAGWNRGETELRPYQG
ncbi:MAG: hypothetical protein ACFNUI_04700 [Negativicutes bacterium]